MLIPFQFSKVFLNSFFKWMFVLLTFAITFSSIAIVTPVEAAYTTTSGYPECTTYWPSFTGDTICYIRGSYQPWSGWNSAAQCNMTNRVDYGGGHVYYFCDGANTAQLTNKEVIVFVRWKANGTFNILQNAELSASINQAPNQPNMYRPQSLWELGPKNNGSYPGVTCSSSGTGQGCNVEFSTRSYDPDFYQWVKVEAQVTRNEGGNRNYIQQLNSNNQLYNKLQNLISRDITYKLKDDTLDQQQAASEAKKNLESENEVFYILLDNII